MFFFTPNDMLPGCTKRVSGWHRCKGQVDTSNNVKSQQQARKHEKKKEDMLLRIHCVYLLAFRLIPINNSSAYAYPGRWGSYNCFFSAPICFCFLWFISMLSVVSVPTCVVAIR